MNKYKKIFSIFVCISIFISLGGFCIKNNVSAKEADIIEKQESIKVFVGGTIRESDKSKEKYIAERKKVLENYSKNKALGVSEATVTFNSFISIDELNNMIKNNSGVKVESIWISIPNQTGRAAISVKDNNFNNAIGEFLKKLKKQKLSSKNEVLKADIDKIINGKYGIFAISVKADNKQLTKLNSEIKTELVDVHYLEDAENMGKKENKKVRYIELPSKPDGTE